MRATRLSFVLGLLAVGAFFLCSGSAVRYFRRLYHSMEGEEEMLIRLGGRDLRTLPA